MGELQNRLDGVDSYLIAKSLIELWITDFIIEYSETVNQHKVVEKWFGVATEV